MREVNIANSYYYYQHKIVWSESNLCSVYVMFISPLSLAADSDTI